jgi:hypothetical protein
MRDEFTWWLERGRPLDLDAVTTVSGDLADLDGAPAWPSSRTTTPEGSSRSRPGASWRS